MRRLRGDVQPMDSEEFYVNVQKWSDKVTELQYLLKLDEEAASKGARALAMKTVHAEGGLELTAEQLTQVDEAIEGHGKTMARLTEMLRSRTRGVDREHAGLLAMQQIARLERFYQLRAEHVQLTIEFEVASAVGSVSKAERDEIELRLNDLRARMDELLAQAQKAMPVQLITLA